MKTLKGLVMKVGKKSITVYTSQGDFLEIPPPVTRPEAGQVIELRLKPKRPLITYAAAAAVMILALALGMFSFLTGPGPVVAYVALDINPSIELFVDQNVKVIKTRALNDQAELVLSSGEVEGADVYRAVDLIVKEAYARGYIKKEDKNLVLASVIPLKEGAADLVDEIKIRDTIYNEMKEQEMPGFVVVNKTWEATEKEAEKMGLPVNKYLVYERMSREGIPVTPEDFRSRSVRQVVEQSGAQIGSLFPEESCEVGREEPGYSGTNPANGVEPRDGAGGAVGQTGAQHGDGSRGEMEHGDTGLVTNPDGAAGNPGANAAPQSGGGEHPGGTPGDVPQPEPSPEGRHDPNEQGTVGHQEGRKRPQAGGGKTTGKDVDEDHSGDRDFTGME